MSALTAALCSSLVPPAAAQSWTAQTGARAELENNSNPALSAAGSEALHTARLAASINAERGSAQGDTRAEGELVLSYSRQDGRGDGSALGWLVLSQLIEADRNTWSARLGYRLERPLENGGTASDVGFGLGTQAVSDLALGWSHALSERLSLEADAMLADTQISEAAAGRGYRLASGRTGLKYRWHETATVSASLGRTQQQLSGDVLRTEADTLRLRWSATPSERTTVQLSVARSDIVQSFTLRSLVCPLPVEFCQSGIVLPVPAEQPVRLRQQQMLYDASGSWRWRETATLAVSASSTLSPGTKGVSQDEAYAVSLSHELGPNTRASLTLDSSRTRPVGAAELVGARLLNLTLTGTHQIDEGISLKFQAQQRHYRQGTPEVRARGTVVSISLQYLGATVPGWP